MERQKMDSLAKGLAYAGEVNGALLGEVKQYES